MVWWNIGGIQIKDDLCTFVIADIGGVDFIET